MRSPDKMSVEELQALTDEQLEVLTEDYLLAKKAKKKRVTLLMGECLDRNTECAALQAYKQKNVIVVVAITIYLVRRGYQPFKIPTLEVRYQK